MTSKNTGLLRQYIHFAFATVSSLLIYSLYSIVDGLFIARGVNEYAMSAVNLVLPYTNLLFSVSVLFAVGTSTVIAILMGEEKGEEAKRIFSQNTLVLGIIGITLTICVFIFIEPIISFLGANELTHDYAREYLTGLAPFSVCFIVSYNMEVLIKTDGFPHKAFRTVLTGCLLNCMLDYVSIFILNMGVFGAALATGISQLLVCLIYFYHFIFCKTSFSFVRFRFDWGIIRRVLPLGFSEAVTEICTGLMIFVFNRVVLKKLGADGLVSYTIIAYTNTLVVNILVGASGAMQPLVSFHHGRKENDACTRLLRYALVTAAVLEAAVVLVIMLGADTVVKVFLKISDTFAVVSSTKALKLYGISYLLMGFNMVFGGYLNAREHPMGALTITAGRGFVFQAAALMGLSMCENAKLIWLAPTVSEIMCIAMALLLLKITNKKQSPAI